MTRRVVALVLLLLAGATAAAEAQSDAVKSAALIGLARTRRDAGDMTSAARHFAAARLVQPLTVDQLAEYFWVLRQVSPRDALAIARDVLRTLPKLDAVREGAISVALDLDDESTVRAFAEEGRMLNGSTALWHRRIGESFLRQRQYSQAADAYGQAVRQKDRIPEDLLTLAVTLTAAERYAEAMPAWSQTPADLLAGRLDLQRLDLQATTRAAAPGVAATRLDAWLALHPEDRLVRSWAIDAWERAGSLVRAFETLRPLMDAPDAEPWLRRGAVLALRLGRRGDAQVAYEKLIESGAATRDDKVAYIGLALRDAGGTRAVAVLDALLAVVRGCADDLRPFVERMTGTQGTNRLLNMARRDTCADSSWGLRAVDRTVADHRFDDALVAIALMKRPPAAVVRTRGLLLEWTGDHRSAIAALTPLVSASPADSELRRTLVDAHRAIGEAYDAWRVGQPLLDGPEAGSVAVLLANVALEADQPAAALRIARGLSGTDTLTELMGRAYLALGNPAAAATTLRTRPVHTLTPQAALALIDAVTAVDGPRAAQPLAASFPFGDAAWEEVGIRYLELLRLNGRPADLAASEKTLCGTDAWPCSIAAAQAALTSGLPLDALKAVEDIQVTYAGRQRRLDQLRASALAALGQYDRAQEIFSRLLGDTPDRIDLVVESLIAQWQGGRVTADQVLQVVDERAPQHLPVRTRVAQVLLAQGRPQDVVTLLTAPGLPQPTVDARVTLARALRADGRIDEALVALGAVALPVDGALLKADLQSATGHRAEAARTLRASIRMDGGTEATWSALAALSDAGAARLDVLREALSALPSSAPLRLASGTEWLRIGQRDKARAEAEFVLKHEPTRREAWTLRADAVAPGDTADAASVASRLLALAPKQPALVLSIADHVAGLVRSSGPELPRRLALAIREANTHWFERGVARLTVARLFAAIEDWTPALASVEAALTEAPDSRPAQRLRADILGWSGRHEESLAAYDRYLTDVPLDWEAARQRARVAGWAGMYARADRHYDDLMAQRPDDLALRAEASAKRAFFDGRWRDAASAYADWIARDPESSEARFERAAALKASGDTAAWERSLVDLKVDAGHRLAAEALQQAFDARRPRLSIVGENRSSSGYAGARLLDLARDGGRVDVTRGAHGGVTLSATWERVRVSTPGEWRTGDFGSLGLMTTLTRRASFDGRIGAWSIGHGAVPDSRVAVLWNATDRSSLIAGVEVTPLFDNLATIEQGLAARGPFAQARWSTPSASVDARVSVASLQDGNHRSELQGSFAHRLPVRGLQVMSWGSMLRNSQPSTVYFSPHTFARLDVGLEYTKTLKPMRFAGDRQKTIRGTYLEGTDNRGTLYHHPAVTFELPFSRQFTMNARGDWVRSAAYRETSFYVGLSYTAGTSTP